VHINYAQLGIFDTVTLGWMDGSHPSYSYRDEMKDRMAKLMAGEHKIVQYELFPRAFHYINDKHKCLSTRGVAMQIMKNDDVSPAQFREDMVKKWQRIEESSGNPLASQYFVPIGRGADLFTTAMTKIFHGQNHFLRSTKMKLVHNLGDMDEVLDLELSEHVDISDEYLTLRNILRSFKVKNTPVIQSIENTNTPGTYRFLYDESMEKYIADLLSNLDSHIKDICEWDATDTITTIQWNKSRRTMRCATRRTQAFGKHMLQQLIQVQNTRCLAQTRHLISHCNDELDCLSVIVL
jgi:hypothetical protein